MLRSIVLIVSAVAFLLSTSSCSSSIKTVEGRKYKPFSKFNFRFDNNQVTSASVYKRYVAYNKKQEAKGRRNKPTMVAKKSTQPKQITPKAPTAKTGVAMVQ